MLTSFTRRDDTDDFFAMIVLSIYMNNEQQQLVRLGTYSADSVPPLFSGFVRAVLNDETTLILEGQCCQLEWDTAVLFLV